MNQLVATLLNVADKTHLKPKHLPPRQGDIKHSFADVDKAKELLHFTPKITLKEGLKNTIA